MRPTRTKTVNGKKVEEYYWHGEHVVYIDNKRTKKHYADITNDSRSISDSITCPNPECCGCLIEKEILGKIECNECRQKYIVIKYDLLNHGIDVAFEVNSLLSTLNEYPGWQENCKCGKCTKCKVVNYIKQLQYVLPD